MFNTFKDKLLIASVVFITAATLSSARPVPEFGSSVKFGKEEAELTMAGLRGKVVLVIFFQSWCGICNKWAPDLITQIEAAHGDNRGMALIALKTDGGGVSLARKYMTQQGANPALWTIGCDNKAEYYKQVYDDPSLWGYILVDTEGVVVGQGSAGSYRTGSFPKRYSLGFKSVLEGCGVPSTRLPMAKNIPQNWKKLSNMQRSDATALH